VGWVNKLREIGVGQCYGLAEVRERLFIGEGDTRAKLSQFWLLLVISSVVAAGGVMADSTPAVIGAMIIAPLATPIYGAALAASIGSVKQMRNSFLLLAGGVALNILIGALAALLIFDRMPIDVNPQITGRTAPTMLDLLIAIAVGVGGSFAMIRRDVSSIVAGVAIAISLVPVLAVVGITLGAGRFELALGAFILFLTNVAAILMAGTFVFGAARYYRDAADASPGAGRRIRRIIAVGVVVLLVPLMASTLRTLEYRAWQKAAQSSAETWLEGTAWRVHSAQLAHQDIVITVVGPGSAPPEEELIAAMRREVPEDITIRIVEVSGQTREY
jgi:uncharacterized hydrophobic protein (TIGR00341 family)